MLQYPVYPEFQKSYHKLPGSHVSPEVYTGRNLKMQPAISVEEAEKMLVEILKEEKPL